MTTQQLFDSFALEGKISTEHAREIMEILTLELSKVIREAYTQGCLSGKKEAVEHIGQYQGWEESQNFYEKRLGLPITNFKEEE